jgi:hypothetical protein
VSLQRSAKAVRETAETNVHHGLQYLMMNE